jgi:osmotically-inducible protein OsmY
MGKARNWRAWVLLGLACVAGCAKSDADRLGRIARMSSEKLDRLTGGARGKVAGGWHAARGSLGEATLDSRVATRLKWDKLLADADIQVKSTAPGVVELTGTVGNQEQRRHALQLANETDGVTSVLDSLQIAAR